MKVKIFERREVLGYEMVQLFRIADEIMATVAEHAKGTLSIYTLHT
jgi:hypothetical protein